ncbi:hypothetical protein EVAR_40690_1 [Eumeta japonica]|uniref:Uncharacterized protein n=1 Tax=Eumeta variegata TaxID=151549 RepID=A0A4C1XAI2_EUMVA|nr:hypothetical protein EVAR_40690_1 [Eumeta japonica]
MRTEIVIETERLTLLVLYRDRHGERKTIHSRTPDARARTARLFACNFHSTCYKRPSYDIIDYRKEVLFDGQATVSFV